MQTQDCMISTTVVNPRADAMVMVMPLFASNIWEPRTKQREMKALDDLAEELDALYAKTQSLTETFLATQAFRNRQTPNAVNSVGLTAVKQPTVSGDTALSVETPAAAASVLATHSEPAAPIGSVSDTMEPQTCKFGGSKQLTQPCIYRRQELDRERRRLKKERERRQVRLRREAQLDAVAVSQRLPEEAFKRQALSFGVTLEREVELTREALKHHAETLAANRASAIQQAKAEGLTLEPSMTTKSGFLGVIKRRKSLKNRKATCRRNSAPEKMYSVEVYDNRNRKCEMGPFTTAEEAALFRAQHLAKRAPQ